MKIDVTLYLVTNSEGLSLSEFLDKIAQACLGGVTLVQLREKEKTVRDYLLLARKVKEVTDFYHIPLIIDDRADVAVACGAAGVHVGQEDLPVWAARKVMGDGKIVGVSAKTAEQAVQAEKEGADYLGVGAIYPTTTKVKTVLTSVSVLREICRSVSIPVAAIGGMNEKNCGILKGCPIAGIAAVSAIMKADDPKNAAARFRERLAGLPGQRRA